MSETKKVIDEKGVEQEARYQTVKGDGERDVSFWGIVLAEVSDSYQNEESSMWTEIIISKSYGGKYAGEVFRRSICDGYVNMECSAYICDSAEELIKNVGFSNLAKEAYKEAGINAAVEID